MLTRRKINILTHDPHCFCLVLHQVRQGGWTVFVLLQELEQFGSSWEKNNAGHILPLLIQCLEEDRDGLPHFSHLLLGVLLLWLPRDSPVLGSWCTHTWFPLALEPWQSCSWYPWHPVCWDPGFPWTNPLSILSSQNYFFLLSPWRTSQGLEEQRSFLGEAGGGEEKVGGLWKDARGCVKQFGKGRCCNIWGDRNISLGGKRQWGGCGRCVREQGGDSDMKVETEVRKLRISRCFLP